MLTRDQIEKLAADYLLKNNHPIVIPGRVVLPEDECDVESRDFLEERRVACVSFKSKYIDDPEYFSVPSVFIVYVNYITGEVHMPRHMA